MKALREMREINFRRRENGGRKVEKTNRVTNGLFNKRSLQLQRK
jgi:hypothetical protein